MKYEFIQVDDDTIKLKYKEKEFLFKRDVKLTKELQGLTKKSRTRMILELSKEGQSVKDLTIETKKDGKTYYDSSNKDELEKIYYQQIALEFFNDKCKELFGMEIEELLEDIGLTNEKEGEEFSKNFIGYLTGSLPRK